MIGTPTLEVSQAPQFLDPEMVPNAPLAGDAAEAGGFIPQRFNTETVLSDARVRFDAILSSAVDRARREVDRFPRSARARRNLGLALMNAGKLDAAKEAFRIALNMDPRDGLAQLNMGRMLAKQDALDQAREWFEQSLALRPDDPRPILNLAELAYRRGQLEEAEGLFRRALELDPLDELGQYSLGALLLERGQAQKAIAYFRGALRERPTSADLHLGLGSAFREEGNIPAAIRSFQAALQLLPGYGSALRALAEAWIAGGNLRDAEKLLEGLLKRTPGDQMAHELLAWAKFAKGDYKAARSQLFKVVTTLDAESQGDREVQARIRNNLGACSWQLHMPDEAAAHFLRSIQLAPSFPLPYHSVARIWIGEKKFSDAREILVACGERFPEDDPSRRLLAAALELEGRYDEAIAVLRAWTLDPHASVESWGSLGCLLTDGLRAFDDAVTVLEQARQRWPSELVIANNLAYTYLMMGCPAEARSVLEPVPRTKFANAPVQTRVVLTATWGLIALWEGNTARARDDYEAAAALAKQSRFEWLSRAVRQKMHLEFARAYRRAGDLEAARKEVRSGLKISAWRFFERDLEELRGELQADRR